MACWTVEYAKYQSPNRLVLPRRLTVFKEQVVDT